ncbi:MAG: GspE/PulE family protein [Patescibacteria group bacterium]
MDQGTALKRSAYISTIENPILQKIFYSKTPEPVSFVDTVIHEVVKLTASDLLFEPRSENVVARTRIDGVLYKLGDISPKVYEHISARIKVLSSLDPTEKRRIQEGQFSLDHDDRIVNLRVEITQTIHGELIVIRVHERRTIVMELSKLGLSIPAYKIYQNMLSQRSGLILVCGPTGCGKTTTLYSTISNLNQNNKNNVMTIEDPVEFQLEGINQMQTQKDTGFTFAVGLRTILRLSPDIVFVGEIRDKETAKIAVESGLTGLLVLSTLHAEDSIRALFRTLDLGIEAYLLNSSLMGIVSQRLIRKNCSDCKVEYKPQEGEIDLFKKVLGRVPAKLMRGRGCEVCQHLTYKGRTGIFEVFEMNAKVRSLIREKTNEDVLRNILIEEGFVTLLSDGLEKAEEGITTVDEVLRNSLRIV